MKRYVIRTRCNAVVFMLWEMVVPDDYPEPIEHHEVEEMMNGGTAYRFPIGSDDVTGENDMQVTSWDVSRVDS